MRSSFKSFYSRNILIMNHLIKVVSVYLVSTLSCTFRFRNVQGIRISVLPRLVQAFVYLLIIHYHKQCQRYGFKQLAMFGDFLPYHFPLNWISGFFF